MWPYLKKRRQQTIRSIKKFFVFSSSAPQRYPTESDAIRLRYARKRQTVLLVLLLIILFFFNRYYEYLIPGAYEFNEHLISFFLININMIMLLLIGYLLLRNIIKVIYERNQKIFGYKLKIKLLLGFAFISVFPVILYYTATQGILQANFDRWFNEKLNVAVDGSNNIITAYKKLVGDELRHFSLILAREHVGAMKDYKINDRFFEYKLFEYRLNGIILYDHALSPLARWFDRESSRNKWSPIKSEQIEFHGLLQPQFIPGIVGESELNRSVVAMEFDDRPFYLEIIRIDHKSGKELFPTIRETLTTFLGLSALEPIVGNTYNMYLMILTLMMIFACLWFALYLAKGITTPIDQLMAVTDKIAVNEFNIDLPPITNDEIGKLTQAFKSMVEAIANKQEELKVSEQNLLDTNEELLERNKFIETVLDNIHYGIVSYNLRGNLLSANSALIAMCEIKKPFSAALHYSTFLPSKYAQAITDMHHKLVSEHRSRESADIYGEIKGQLKHINLRLFALKDENNQHIGMLAVFHDITDIDHSTRASAWQEIARRIAHEIKNPLTPIQLSAQRIRHKFIEKNEPDRELLDKSTNTIIRKVTALKNIVNEFDNFARIPEVKLQNVDLEKLADDVVALYQSGISGDIVVKKVALSPIPMMVLDPEHINRALVNIVKNAIEAIQTYQQVHAGYKGHITIELKYDAENNRVCIDVSDNGNGIQLQNPQSVFDPYVTGKKHGTGLGLAIVRRIISDHDGFIHYEHNTPNGSILKIELPVKKL